MDFKTTIAKRKAGNNKLPFGKHKWETLKFVNKHDPDYLGWLMIQDWFKEKFEYLYLALEKMGYEERTEYIYYNDFIYFDNDEYDHYF